MLGKKELNLKDPVMATMVSTAAWLSVLLSLSLAKHHERCCLTNVPGQLGLEDFRVH